MQHCLSQHPPRRDPLLFRFASYRHPEHAETIQQVLAIPRKKTDTGPRSFLTGAEMDALVAAPDRSTWCGRRDHALLVVALRTGLRLSELTGLRRRDVDLRTAPHVKCLGKGRKRRDTPLDKPTVELLHDWMGERRGEPDDALFPSRRGGRLSPDAVQRLVAKHVTTARIVCPSIVNKQISTHNLRHYVDGRVMWPVGMLPLPAMPCGPVPAT
jgi:integrase